MYDVVEYSPVINMICIIVLTNSLIGFAKNANEDDNHELSIGDGIVNILSFIVLFLNVFSEGIIYISNLF